MDRKEKRLQLLGALGIVKEAFRIMRSQAKLLGTITLVLILPFYLITVRHSLMTPFLLAMMIIPKQITEDRSLPILQLTELLLLEIFYADFFHAALMPSMAAVGYTVANVYRKKHQSSFARVMRLLSAVWKPMMITCLWYFIIDFMIFMTSGFAMWILALGFLELGELRNSYSILFYLSFIVVCMVLFLVSVYVRMVFQVAIVVCILEKRYCGLEGMKKSHRLIHGKRTAACVLAIAYSGISNMSCFTGSKGDVYAVGLGAKIAYGTACLVMACVVALIGMLTQSVLYFLSRSYHGERIEE
ncbi:hypothetical protein SUGI_1197030 [Cryptomeria japonica]|uniref:uncharacterized protein LOC131079001 n=1 Tax=Cryptomeria japonica TaxID=3369 RepID=UPI0024149631|nr:uncharacterized protein LOC131079001 [Cryptomeria japonica]GLJ55730.1 hypothetical protein SUGI_1197030 [Cryptomeria japonica]